MSLRFARPQGRARIETPCARWAGAAVGASPGLKAGRGLKHPHRCWSGRCRLASPGLKAGRGLKPWHRLHLRLRHDASPGLKAGRGLKQGRRRAPAGRQARFARPQGRARIETSPMRCALTCCCSFARPQGRARIETKSSLAKSFINTASPGLKAGRGLKPLRPLPHYCGLRRFARPQGRARIETPSPMLVWPLPSRASPGLKAGRGLKLDAGKISVDKVVLRPASRPGAD